MSRQPMPISSRWFQGAVLTYLVGFTVLGILAYLVYRDQPPMPGRVVAGNNTLFTRDDIVGGMNVFQRYGLMEYGSVYGHGAYLGPDFTAEYLHKSAEFLIKAYSGVSAAGLSARERVAAELHENTYDPAKDSLVWSVPRAEVHRMMVEHYRSVFYAKQTRGGAQAEWITEPDDIRKLTAFFAWTAWTAAANRPGHMYSYTNNWPPEPLAENFITADAITWSVISIIGLLGGTGLILYFFGRYDWLGWSGEETKPVQFRPADQVAVTPAQRAIVWFLFVSSLLFVLQTLTGGLIAHYRAEPGGFFGIDFSAILPFNIMRTWHVQLAIFWVSASYLATGIFIVPLIAGKEPRGQSALTILLLIAVAIVVFGSLAGEYAGAQGWLGEGLWFWLGHQGWEYLDLGRLWQILLIVGLSLWVFILFRGLSGTLRDQHFGNMPWMLFYAALAIPAFYAVGLLASPHEGFVVNDFWRFWVVHLWVEDFLELFTTVVVAYMFVLLGVIRQGTALRVIYLDIILYSLGGVIGTMHHLYFSGTPVAHLALGATFSAMEVIPLMLLTLEGLVVHQIGRAEDTRALPSAPLGHLVSRVCRCVELPRRRCVWIFDQSAGRELLRNRHGAHCQSRPHRDDGSLRYAGRRTFALLLALLDTPREVERSRRQNFFLVAEYRFGVDGVRKSFPAGYGPALLRCGYGLLVCAQFGFSQFAVGQYSRMGALAGGRVVYHGRGFTSDLALLAGAPLSKPAPG
jgi:nitric oxide reductase subunit B